MSSTYSCDFLHAPIASHHSVSRYHISRWDSPLIGDLRKEVNENKLIQHFKTHVRDASFFSSFFSSFHELLQLLHACRWPRDMHPTVMASQPWIHLKTVPSIKHTSGCGLSTHPHLPNFERNCSDSMLPISPATFWDRRSHRVDIPQKCAKLIPNSQNLQAAEKNGCRQLHCHPQGFMNHAKQYQYRTVEQNF